MKKNDVITHLISNQVVCIQAGQPLSDVRRMMSELAIHHVPIVDGKKLIGLVSFTDMMTLDLITHGATEQTIDAIIDQQFSIKVVMSSDLITLNDNDNVRSAVEILAEGKFHSLPVIDDEDNLIGIVTSTDLIRYLKDQY
jgi:CBS domain-containing membrane protein